MGGHIWARLRKRHGSEFGFALAVYPADEVDEFEEAAQDTRSNLEGAQRVALEAPADARVLPVGRAEP